MLEGLIQSAREERDPTGYDVAVAIGQVAALAESIAGSLERIAVALEKLTLPHNYNAPYQD